MVRRPRAAEITKQLEVLARRFRAISRTEHRDEARRILNAAQHDLTEIVCQLEDVGEGWVLN